MMPALLVMGAFHTTANPYIVHTSLAKAAPYEREDIMELWFSFFYFIFPIVGAWVVGYNSVENFISKHHNHNAAVLSGCIWIGLMLAFGVEGLRAGIHHSMFKVALLSNIFCLIPIGVFLGQTYKERWKDGE